MKFAVLIVIFTVSLQIGVNCHNTQRIKRDIPLLGTIANKTYQFTNYIKEKGRSLKYFYEKNVNKIKFYVSNTYEDTVESVEDFHTKVSNKFKRYVDIAEKMSSTIYEVIAPEKKEYECDDSATINDMTTTQLTALHGYISESHTILTEDGYLLTVHRIPHAKNYSEKISKKTVLLHHGLLATSADWVIPGPDKGLAYILAEAGYDVWMANVRGNTYSRAHVSRDVKSYEFWDFSFHEVGQYDLPAVIDYIVKLKGKDVELNYIGFSMGTTALFALLSTRTEYNTILRAGFAMAPIAYMSQVKSPFKLISKYGNDIEYLMKLLGQNEFLPRNAALRYLSKHSCKVISIEEAVCELSMFMLCGHDEHQFNRSLKPLIFGHVPAGASTKTLAHYAQEIQSEGYFKQFDYGQEENMKRYGSEFAPKYQTDKITLPISLFSGEDDWLSSVDDAKILYSELNNPIEHYTVPLKEFNHLDFLFAKDTPTLVYDRLLQLLAQTHYDNSVDSNFLSETTTKNKTSTIT